MIALIVFAITLLVFIKDTESPSATILSMDDLDEWRIGLQSALAAGSDVLWQLETLEEVMQTGRSDDAGRLLEWMREVEESNER